MYPMALTPKQELFCQEYLVDLNATQAAIRAGYSAKSAKVIAAEILSKPEILLRIQDLQAKRLERVEINQDWVLDRLKEISDRCMQAVPVLDSEGNETGEYKFDSAGAIKSTELIGKHHGMFTQKIEGKIETTQPMTDDQVNKIINTLRATKAS